MRAVRQDEERVQQPLVRGPGHRLVLAGGQLPGVQRDQVVRPVTQLAGQVEADRLQQPGGHQLLDGAFAVAAIGHGAERPGGEGFGRQQTHPAQRQLDRAGQPAVADRQLGADRQVAHGQLVEAPVLVL